MEESDNHSPEWPKEKEFGSIQSTEVVNLKISPIKRLLIGQ